MTRQSFAWLVCTTAAMVGCAMGTPTPDASRDTGVRADVQSQPDAVAEAGPGMDAMTRCPAGENECSGVCRDLQTNDFHCGACNRSCNANQRCVTGACQNIVMCGAGQTDCSGTCVNTQTDSNNCGACGMACPAGQSCNGGACRMAIMCPAGQTECGGACVDLQTSATNCGACGNACAAGQVCATGACAAPMCTGAETLCGGRCVNTQTDVTNCGACGNACPAGQRCTTGACVPDMMMCAGGQTNCSGVCVTTATDRNNCGACGRACAMGQTCTAGTCTGTVVCPMGQTACGAACADLQSDAINCGMCGRACAAGQTCTAGTCVMGRPMCPAGQTDCTPMAAAPTCVDTQTSAMNCGACGTACGMGQTCNAGACVCGGGQLLCGRTCINAQTDNNNCGRCGTVCAAGTTCQSGTCRCPAGQMSCSGACVNTNTDNNNCGACGTACTGGKTCSGGVCTCPAGTTACGMSGTCVNTQTDRANCGACGMACSAGQSCVAGACACPAGQTLCSGACVDLQTNAGNCGACGMACGAGTSCRMGACSGMPPANDTRAGATNISLTMPSQTLMADTSAARNDTMGSCACSSGNDVFYRFVLTQPELVLAETLGASWDTSLFIQDSMGANVTAPAGFVTCNDDTRECGQSGLQSMIYTRLNAGTYFLVLSGCGAGTASIKFQHLPAGNGTSTRITPDATVRTAMSAPTGTGAINSACCSGGPENSLFWLTCPMTGATTFNASTCNAMTGASTATYDVELAQYSALRVAGPICNDDAGGTTCGTGASLNSLIPATSATQIGLNTVVVDSCVGTGTATVNYVLANCTTGTRCGATCVETNTDANNCGGCNRRCAAGNACVAGVCVPPPSNDRPANAVVINMTNAQSTFTVDTTAAVNDTSGSCLCTTGGDAFYSFTLTRPEIVYADTIGSMRDTSLFFQSSAGANIASAGLANGTTCNDDNGLAGCNTTRQSQIMALLPAGTYRLVVSGCGAGGPTNLRFQHLPTGNGTVTALNAGNSTPAGTTSGTGRITASCNTAGAENTYYWFTCGTATGGTFTASTCARATWDTSLHQLSAARASGVVCNDDVGGTCGLRSSITSTIPAGAGIHTLYVDGAFAASSGAYTVAVNRP